MRLLVAINNNIPEWRSTTAPSGEMPRLPLPYAFGGAFLKRGHQLSAINVSDTVPSGELYPFSSVHPVRNLTSALKGVDVAALWGGLGVSAILRQGMITPMQRRVVLCSYVWALNSLPTMKGKQLGLATQLAGQFAKAVVVMTEEQADLARRSLFLRVPVIKFRCGIDTAYYRIPSSICDVPETHRKQVGLLLTKPYVIMPGDELRCDNDVLELVQHSDIRLVRISQYANSDKQNRLRAEVKRRGIQDRFFVFEKISYAFMRFLLQNASAYAGLVDSSWQPAGWTVVCEALSSGLPVVVYDGLVTRELAWTGVDPSICRSVPMGNIPAFQDALQYFVSQSRREDNLEKARSFSQDFLDFKQTADDFVVAMEKVVD